MNMERLFTFLKYIGIFSFVLALIVALLIGINGLADNTWIWSRQ